MAAEPHRAAPAAASPADARPASARAPVAGGSAVRDDEIGIVSLIPEPWGEQLMARHQITRRLAQRFHVVCLEPAAEWRTMLGKPWRVIRGEPRRRVGPLEIVHPRIIPHFYGEGPLARWSWRRRLAPVYRRLRREGCRYVVLYLWRPQFAAARLVPGHDVVIYHVTDEYSFSSVERPVDPVEGGLLRDVDQVIVHSPALYERKGPLSSRAALVPNGVDFAAFATARAEPADLAPIPRPRIGYSGFIKNQLDWPLLDALAARHPEWSFVFVGSVRGHAGLDATIEQLRQRPNVYFLGAKSTDALAAYAAHFDVAMLPYVRDDYTKYIYPLKLHEYAAAGRPIVGTSIRTLLDYPELVVLADDVDGWSAAIIRALRPESQSPVAAGARRAVAARHDWDVLTDRVAALVRDAVVRRRPAAGGDEHG